MKEDEPPPPSKLSRDFVASFICLLCLFLLNLFALQSRFWEGWFLSLLVCALFVVVVVVLFHFCYSESYFHQPLVAASGGCRVRPELPPANDMVLSSNN